MRKPAAVRVSKTQLEYWHVKQAAWIPMSPVQIQAMTINLKELSARSLFALSDRLNALAELGGVSHD